MKRSVFFGVASLYLLSACTQPSLEGDVSQSDLDAAKVSIDDTRARFQAAVASGDMAALGALVHDDTIMVQPGDAAWRAMQAQAAGLPFAPGATIEITPLEVIVIDAEWAYEFGASVVTYLDDATGEAEVLRDTYLLILRNRGDGYKPFREVASASAPPGGWPSAIENQSE